MADDYSGLLNITGQYHVYERDIIPEIGNVYYTNVNYTSNLGFNGYNKFAARRPTTTGGWVLPNCTGYSYGRVLETCNLTKCDCIAGDASQWFDYNKNLFDNKTGGYPYIQLKSNDMGFNIGSGFQATSNANLLYKLILSLCRPGNVVCYGEGTSSLNGGMIFGEEGHVQTIERLWADADALEKYNRDLKIGGYVVSALVGMLGAYLLTQTVAIAVSIIKDISMYLSLYKAGSIGLAEIEALIASYVAKGWISEEGGINLMEDLVKGVIDENGYWYWEFLKETIVDFAINAGRKTITLGGLILLMGALGYGTAEIVQEMLNGVEFSGLPTMTISQSSANGYSSSSSIGLWNQDRIDFSNTIGTIEGDETLHGIIVTPCQEPPQFAHRGSFPWQLGNNIGLYD